MSFKGLPFIGKMNELLDRALYATVQKVGNSRAAIEVIHKGYYDINSGATYTVEAGSDDNLLVKTAHTFKVGDLIRFASTANNIQEFEIVIDEIIDANTVKLAGYLSASLTAGDTYNALRAVSEKFAADGSTLATLSTPPISYNRKAAGSTVQTTVLEDLDTPANSRGLPVVIHSVDGAPIVVNAGDLSVSISHANDSVAIGDGTNLVGVTASNELKTHDADAKTELQAINTELDTQTTTLGNIDTSLNNIEADVDLIASTVVADGAAQPANGQLIGGHNGAGLFRHMKVSNTGEVIVEVATSALPTGAATEAKQDAEAVLIGAVTETAPGTDTASSGLNGRLQRIAQRITSLISLFPASIGQKTSANSFAVTIASDQSAVAVSDSSSSSINTNIGAQADAVAATDTGTFSLISLTKKIAQNITAMSAKLPAALGATTSAASLSVAPATDAVFSTKPKALTNSYAEYLTLTTVQTFTAPASAIGGKIMAQDSNSANVRYKQNGTATTTSGMQLQPGRSEDFTGGSDITVVSESGTNAVFIQWTIQA